MIPNDKLLNALRSLKFEFKRQTERVAIYKQRGTSLRSTVSKRSLHDEDYVRDILRRAGMASDAIENFIREARQTSH